MAATGTATAVATGIVATGVATGMTDEADVATGKVAMETAAAGCGGCGVARFFLQQKQARMMSGRTQKKKEDAATMTMMTMTKTARPVSIFSATVVPVLFLKRVRDLREHEARRAVARCACPVARRIGRHSDDHIERGVDADELPAVADGARVLHVVARRQLPVLVAIALEADVGRVVAEV